jgi:hypothetical protein
MRTLRGVAAVVALAACGLSAPSDAGQAGSGFLVTINIQPANGSCTAAVDAAGGPLVNCEPTVIGSAGTASGRGAQRIVESGISGYRIPDARMKVAGAVVELGEDNFHAWGEYSSRMILAGGVEYVEMTVTW